MKKLIQKIQSNKYQKHDLDLSIDNYCDNGNPKITYDELYLLVIALNNNSYVKKIDLTNQNITDNMVMLLVNLKNIESIDLTGCGVTVLGANLLAKSNLKELFLCGNAIFYKNEENCFFEEMIKNFANNKTIILLNLLYLQIPDNLIANLIANNFTIQTLYLPRNLKDMSLETLKYNNSIKELIIDDNQLTDIGAKYITNNITLSKVLIENSMISNKGAFILSKCNNLEKLVLVDSNIDEKGANEFLNSNINDIIIFNRVKHDLISYKFLNNFEIEFQQKQQQKLIEQKEYYQYLTGNYLEDGTILSIQLIIDTLQKQEELNLIGNDSYWN